ncbi:MAG: helicase-exonuclease AddAB subunit AddA [Lachnospiraceae bacterium]
MGKVEFTTDQTKVINAPVCDLLVSAAAGSGKTAVLVERILKHICDPDNPIDVDRILIVTFTNNAASSMKDKIYKRLEELCKAEPENKRYTSQLRRLSYADIMTIDSFCLKIIRNYFYVADMDPNFRIADRSECDLLLYDSIKEVFEKEYINSNPAFNEFLSLYANTKSDANIVDLVKNLIRFSQSALWQEEYLRNLDKMYKASTEQELSESPIMSDLHNYSLTVLGDCLNLTEQAIHLAESDPCFVNFESVLKADRSLVKSIAEADDYMTFRDRLKNRKFVSAPRITSIDESAHNLFYQIKDIREKMKGRLNDLEKKYYDLDLAQIVQDNITLRPYIVTLSDISLKVLKRYTDVKRSKNIMEFSDISHAVLNILVKKEEDGTLVPTVYAKEIRKKYDEIMIDEYQDSNYIQEVILSSISGRYENNPNVFMVGDVKQSIYKFRMAKPEIFMQKYATYGRGNDKSLVIDLKKNFRSSACVIGSVNDIFCNIMTENVCGITYDEHAALNQGADYKAYDYTSDAINEYTLIDMECTEADERYIFTATAIACKIKDLMNNNFTVHEGNTSRALRYSDIVILVRSLTGSATELANRLTDEGIPVVLNSNSGYFKTTEVKLMLNFMRILDNPYQDIEMAAVLRSYCAGITDEELALIKIHDKSVNDIQSFLYDAAIAYMKSEDADEETREKLSAFFDIYLRLSEISEYTSVSDILSAVYEETGYYSYVSVLPAGESRKANLDMLLVKARDYEKTGFSGIHSFIKYVDKMIKYNIDVGEAAALECPDTVNVMTIHCSKGLEYPVVILADTERKFNLTDEKASFVLHGDKGIGLKVINKEDRSYHYSLQKKFISGTIHKESIAEEIRILYVALTRAKQKLCVFAAYDDLSRKLKDWKLEAESSGDTLTYSYLFNASSYADLMMPVILKSLPDSDRSKLGEQEETIKASENMQINVMKQDTLIRHMGNHINDRIAWELPKATDGSVFEDVEKYFSYEYPFITENIPVKCSVSQLKHKAMEELELAMDNSTIIKEYVEEEEVAEPAFITGNKISVSENRGALRGTMTHMLMQRIVTMDIGSVDELENYVNKMIASGEFNEDMRLVNLRKAFNFLETDIGHKIKAAAKRGDLFLEQPFVLGMPACEVDDKYTSGELVMVQGVIDLFYIENGEAVLLDYKTDSVSPEDGEEVLKNRYRRQIEIYSDAIEKIKKISIKCKIIYSFSLEKDIYL